jgi:hypothetical protein
LAWPRPVGIVAAMGKTVQKGVRMPEEWIPRLARVGKALSPHVDLNEATVLRAVVGAGLDTLEAKFGLSAEQGSKPAAGTDEKVETATARKPKRKS